MKKILFTSNAPAPYRSEFFRLCGQWADVTVLFEKKSHADRDKSWAAALPRGFTAVFADAFTLCGQNFRPDIGRYMKGFDEYFIMDFASPCGMAAIAWLRRRGIEYYLESDGGFAKDGNGLRERLKRKYIPGAKGYFSTSPVHDEYYLHYGAERERLIRYPFSSVLNKDVRCAPPDAEEKAALRVKLGLKGKYIVLSVGQFIPRKGFDLLIKCAKGLPQGTEVYIIGGEKTAEYDRIISEENITNVSFLPFMSRERVNEYYDAADVFALPTREDIWGLVVNEALSRGLPVVSADRCLSAVQLLSDGKAGVIIPTESVPALTAALCGLLNDVPRRAVMSAAALNIAAMYTVETMAEAHREELKIEN